MSKILFYSKKQFNRYIYVSSKIKSKKTKTNTQNNDISVIKFDILKTFLSQSQTKQANLSNFFY